MSLLPVLSLFHADAHGYLLSLLVQLQHPENHLLLSGVLRRLFPV